jgi:type VI secretion system secreted protein Hcp
MRFVLCRTKLALSVAVLALSFLPVRAQAAADRAYVKIEGKTQGTFKGEATRVAGTNYIAVVRYNYEVTSPHDSATGQPTGRRQHMAVVITKALDATSPQIFQALATNEVLTQVTIEFLTSTVDGKEITYYTVTLKNATISDIHQHMNQTQATAASGSPVSTEPMEDVSFTFQDMTVASNVGQTTATDSWAASTK